ncbi:MAG: DUF1489 domain-containing protein [Rhizobiales bacterium]|nr:DUF1489 domain-containing protein [Hyphomicrobiales bacterium]
MALHLIKMAAGISSLQELEERQTYLRTGGSERARLKKENLRELIHVTRFFPKRADEILNKDNSPPGSLYWVFQKRIQARQKIAEFREMPSEGGASKCGIVLEGPLVPVEMMPRKAFQGWRYLTKDDAPKDLNERAFEREKIPPQMHADLIELCLL